jgi:hypothetical protein
MIVTARVRLLGALRLLTGQDEDLVPQEHN